MPVIPFNCATGEAMPVTLAVAPTVALAPPDDSVDSNSVVITGTGTISSFGAGVVGVPITKQVQFVPTGGSITIKESASLDVLGTADHVITKPAYAEYRWDGVGVWTELSYSDASVPGGGYLPLTGGTLTGNLQVTPTTGGAYLQLNGAAGSGAGLQISGSSGTERFIVGQTAGSSRWVLDLGTTTSESGSNAGSDFVVARFGDNGAYIDSPFQITRSNGVTTVSNLVDNGNCTVSGAINCATYWNNPTFTGAVTVNGAISGGSSLTINGQFYSQGGQCLLGQTYFVYPTIGAWVNYYSSPWQICQYQANWYWRWSNASGQLDWVGNGAVQFSVDPSGNVTCQHNLTAAGQILCGNTTITNNQVWVNTNASYIRGYGQCGHYSDGNYFMMGESAEGSSSSSWRYYFAKATGVRNFVNYQNTNLLQISGGGACVCPGGFTTGSDANMKRDIEPATHIGLEALLQITPSYFTRIHDEPPEDHPEWRVPERREFGFIAQDVQKALPDAVITVDYEMPIITGDPDDPTIERSTRVEHSSSLAIDPIPLIAALVNTIKQLHARIEALEAASMARMP